MAIFVNQTKGYFLITSFKVMHSTLSAHDNLQEIFLTNYLDCLKFKVKQRQQPTSMLVRNPYTRLISFFEDKFVRYPSLSLEQRIKYCDNPNGWQHCQVIFFPYLDISLKSKPETISNTLCNTTFAQFISYLPSVYLQDQHLAPQTSNLKFTTPIKSLNNQCQFSYIEPIKIELEIDRLFKMEKLDRDLMKQEFDLDLTIIRNPTRQRKPWNNYFNSPQLVAIVNQLYQSDFKMFDYTSKWV